jgi:hypothetical protein
MNRPRAFVVLKASPTLTKERRVHRPVSARGDPFALHPGIVESVGEPSGSTIITRLVLRERWQADAWPSGR